MAKPEKTAEADATDAPPKKSKKKLIIIIAVVVVLAIAIGGGAAVFLSKKGHEAEGAAVNEAEEKAASVANDKNPPKFVDLGTFTANLVREEGDQFLQAAITLKLSKPELEPKVKERSPEIMHRVNMLLQSKRPSELITYDDKTKLSKQIKAQVEFVLGLRKKAPIISSDPVEAAADEAGPKNSGITDVLFTSFIIQ